MLTPASVHARWVEFQSRAIAAPAPNCIGYEVSGYCAHIQSTSFFVCNVNKCEGMARHCVDEDIDILTKQLITSLIGFQVIIVIVGISCLITNHIVPLWGCPFPRNRAIIIVKCVTKMYQIAILVFLYFIRTRSHLSTVIAWAASSPRGYDSDSRRSALIWKC